MDDNFIDDKVHSVVKLPHGYFEGSIERNAELAPTIDTGVGNWHTLIGEETVYGVALNESEDFKKSPMKECSRTLLANKANCGEGVLISQCECLGMLEGGKWDNSIESSRRVYSTQKASPTVTTCGGGNQEIKIAEPLALDEQNGYIRQDGTVGTIVTDGSSPKHNNRVVEPMPNMRVRKLTPKECFRLMGVKDEDYERVARNQSKSSLYHLAGDSIIVNVLMAIFKELFM